MTDPVPTRASDFVFTKIFTDYENGFWKGAHMRTIDLTGKTAVVTGGSGTLCSVMASGFAENGAKVAIIGRNKEKLAKVVEQIISDIEKKNGTTPVVKGYSCDVTNKAELEKTKLDEK